MHWLYTTAQKAGWRRGMGVLEFISILIFVVAMLLCIMWFTWGLMEFMKMMTVGG
jgi:hypothetical protein